MGVEVISLISSSEAGSPAQQRTRQPSPRPSSPRRSDVQGRALGSGRLYTATVPHPQENNTGTASSVCRPNATAAGGEVWLISDDEADPAGNACQPGGTLIDGPVSKRCRLEPFSQDISSPNVPGAPAIPSVAALSAERLKNTIRSRANWPDEDPFASSSPPVTEQAPLRINKQPRALPSSFLDDNPFASSSPQLKESKPAQRSTRPAIDDIDPFASSSPGPVRRPAKSAQAAAAWDPISSSAPLPAADEQPANPPRSFRRTQSEVIALDESDNDGRAQLDSEDDFPDITNLATSKPRCSSLPKPLHAVTAVTQAPKKSKSVGTKPNSAEPKKSDLEKAKEREEKATAREAEKERKRLEKERAKEERIQEKARAAALAEVNKIRTDKKVSTPEMIVDLPATLDENVKLQAETLLRDLDVQSAGWSSPVENVVKWRRKVRSRYNTDLGHWEPVQEHIERENYAMVIIPASKFVDLVLGEESASLESHVLRMKRHFPNDTIIYLIEGLDLWLRKNRNVRNRQFVSAVRSGLEPVNTNTVYPPPGPGPGPGAAPPSSQPQRKRKTTTTTTQQQQTYISEETVETALLHLQVLHNLLIHHTTIPLETARWIAVFTQHISTVPYRRQRDAATDAAAGFCMETGQVRTGDGPRDTYVRMLQEIGRVTAPIAYGIAGEFETVGKLVKGLEEGGPLRLEKVRKSVNKEGEASERMVGQAVSRRVYKIFTGRDESSTDI